MEQLAELAIRAHVANTQAAAPQALVEREQQELKVTNRQSQQRMLYDPLTKIYNRQFFDEALNNELARSIRQATSIGLVLCDVDHFKQINDTYSHLRGDAVLQRISRILRGVLRKSDVLARYGGEEFVILASQPTEKGLAKLAERIRERVEAEPFACEAKEFSVTISVGAVIALPSRHDETVGERLIAVADEQLDKAKHNGRNQVCLRSLLSDSEKRVAETVSSLRLSHWLVNRNILDLPSMAQALAHSQVNRVRIGELGERVGYLTGEQVGQIRDEQERSGKRFGATAIQLGFLSEETCADLLALQLEEPNSLAGALVEIGLLEPDYAAALIKEYLADTQVGQRRPNGVSMSS
jgi:diguanylate cyclase (GGDEF)-like protein